MSKKATMRVSKKIVRGAPISAMGSDKDWFVFLVSIHEF